MEIKIKDMIEELCGEYVEDDNQDLLATDVLDSFSMVNLVIMIEEEYGIEIDAEYVTPDNFRSVKTIADLVNDILGN